MKKLLPILVILMLLSPIKSSANNDWDSDMPLWLTIVLMEINAVTFSSLAVLDPKAYANTHVFLIAPVLLSGGKESDYSTTERWINIIGLEAIGLYNYTLIDKEPEIVFRDNIIAWHTYFLISYLGYELFGNNGVFTYAPQKGGGMLYYSYRF